MRVPLLIAALAVAGSAQAHDVWIQPAIFAAPLATEVPLTIFVGHAELRQRWGVSRDRVTRFDDIAGGRSRDRRGEVHPDSGNEDARLRFDTPGTHLLVMASTAAFSELPSIRYNDFVKVEGLTAVTAYRTAKGLTDTPGRETYSRCAKALIQVGSGSDGNDAVITRPAMLKLEIVPLHNPYTLAPTDDLPVQVLYMGKPLAGALVKLTNLDFDAHPIATKRSDANGRAALTIPRRGKWQLNVVWSVPVAGNPKADFETIFSSLTFGFQPPAPAD